MAKRLPGEFTKRSLVTIEMDEVEAALFAPEKLSALQQAQPGRILRDSAVVEENYVLKAHRLDGRFDYTIEHDGSVFRLPGKVIDRLLRMRAAIITENRREQGRSKMRRTAEEDQEEADRQPLMDPTSFPSL